MTTETEPRIHCVQCKREATEQRARVRELEAGLLGCRQARSELEWKCARLARLAQLANEATARAEEAEAESKRLERILERDHDENCKWRVAEVGRLRARVAELERALEQRHGQIAAMLLEKAGRDYEHIPPDVGEREAD